MEWLNNWINRQNQKRFEQAVSIQAARNTPGKISIGNWRLPDYGITETLFGGPSGGRNDYQFLENRNNITQNAKQEGSVLNVPVPPESEYTSTADTRNEDIAGAAEDAGRTVEDMTKIHSEEGLETVIGGEDDTPVPPPNLEEAEKAVDLAKARKQWLHDTRNSPAARAGVFTEDERWNQHLMNQDFQKAKKSGTLAEFAAKYPNSQTARKMRTDKSFRFRHTGSVKPWNPSVTDKVDDFLNNGNEEEINNEQINNEEINNEQTNNEQTNNEQTNGEQTNGEDQSVSEKVDDLVEDLTNGKNKKPTNPIEMIGF